MTRQFESDGKIRGMDFYKMTALIDVKMSSISKDILWSLLLIIDIFGLFMTQNGSSSLWLPHSRRSSGWTLKPSQPDSLGIGWVSSVHDCWDASQLEENLTFCIKSAAVSQFTAPSQSTPLTPAGQIADNSSLLRIRVECTQDGSFVNMKPLVHWWQFRRWPGGHEIGEQAVSGSCVSAPLLDSRSFGTSYQPVA